MRSYVAAIAALVVLTLSGCGDSEPSSDTSTGGGAATGGASSGGVLPTGGVATGGLLPTGGVGTGGSLPTGGVGTGGLLPTGGTGTGSSPPTGGVGAGGIPPTGGAGTGGLPPTGGAGTGGSPPTGGAGTGGVGTGGTGGVATGGVGASATGGAGSDLGGTGGATGGTGGTEDPLADLVPSAESIGLLLANRFNQQALAYSSVANLPGDGYKNACEWYGALGVASLTDSQSLLDSLVAKFDPLKGDFVSAMLGGDAHVDRYIYGMVPLEIYLQTEDASYLTLGTQTADNQQVTNQTRDAIDDMFMMTGLQLEAYRATGDVKYLNFMSDIMVTYLAAQQSNGLFFHNVTQARVHWGRGNGWFAAGMAEMLRDLPTNHQNYATIEAGYKRMMEGLVPLQSPNGLWYQVLDMPSDPSNWEESSCTGMFTYAMIAGVKRGILDAVTYVPVIESAWAGLQTKISPQGNVSDICTGTWYHATPQEYMALTRLTGDGHGQAPVLWAAAELLRQY